MSVLKLKAVPIGRPKRERRESKVQVNATSKWEEYTVAVEVFRYDNFRDGLKSRADFVRMEKFKREALSRAMPQGRQMAFSKMPTVLSEKFISQLRAENTRERKKREPYFFEAAALYAKIDSLNSQAKE